MLGIPNLIGRPIGDAAALLDGLRVLPQIAENTAAMAEATQSLPMLVEIQGSLRDVPASMAGLDSGLGRLPGGNRE